MKFTKECFNRAIRTFLQSALAYLTVNIVLIDFNAEKDVIKTALIGLAISTLAAGISAVMNLETKGGCDNGNENG